MRKCADCSFFSESHSACFHPDYWTQGEFFKVPGNPIYLNSDGKCRNFENVQSLGHRIKRFFRTIFVFKVVR